MKNQISQDEADAVVNAVHDLQLALHDTVTRFAARLPISKNAVWFWYRGRRLPSRTNLARMADIAASARQSRIAKLLRAWAEQAAKKPRPMGRPLGRRRRPKPKGPLPKPLTPRESQVLDLLLANHKLEEIAVKLALPVRVIEVYASNLRYKFGVRTTDEMIVIARRQGAD